MIDFVEAGKWLLSLVLCLAIVAFVFGLVWLCFAHPLAVLWFVAISFIFILMHKG